MEILLSKSFWQNLFRALWRRGLEDGSPLWCEYRGPSVAGCYDRSCRTVLIPRGLTNCGAGPIPDLTRAVQADPWLVRMATSLPLGGAPLYKEARRRTPGDPGANCLYPSPLNLVFHPRSGILALCPLSRHASRREATASSLSLSLSLSPSLSLISWLCHRRHWERGWLRALVPTGPSRPHGRLARGLKENRCGR